MWIRTANELGRGGINLRSMSSIKIVKRVKQEEMIEKPYYDIVSYDALDDEIPLSTGYKDYIDAEMALYEILIKLQFQFIDWREGTKR